MGWVGLGTNSLSFLWVEGAGYGRVCWKTSRIVGDWGFWMDGSPTRRFGWRLLGGPVICVYHMPIKEGGHSMYYRVVNWRMDALFCY